MDWLPRMLSDGTAIPFPSADVEHANRVRPEPSAQAPCVYALKRSPEPGTAQWQEFNSEIPARPAPTEEQIDAMAEEYQTVTNAGPKLITPVVNRLIGLLETQNCDGYEFDRDDDDENVIHGSFHFHLAGSEADTLEAYFNKNLLEQEEEFQRELPEIRRQLAEIRGKR